MKQFLSVMLLVALTACGSLQGETTQQKFFGVKQDYLKAVTAAAVYKQDCKPKPAADACHKIVKQVQDKDNIVFALVQTADAIIVNNGSEQSILTYINDIQAGVFEINKMIKE